MKEVSVQRMSLVKGILCSMFLVGTSCALQSNRTHVVENRNPSQAMAEAAKSPAPEGVGKDVVSTIQFPPGQHELTPEATAELNRAILEAKEKGQLQNVDVAVWSDWEASTQDSNSIPKEQVQVAKARAQNIQSYLDRMEPDAKIRVHNMASNPSSFSKWIQSQDLAAKNQLLAMGIDPAKASETGKPSSALVFLKLK